jgi:hypothetical protein
MRRGNRAIMDGALQGMDGFALGKQGVDCAPIRGPRHFGAESDVKQVIEMIWQIGAFVS